FHSNKTVLCIDPNEDSAGIFGGRFPYEFRVYYSNSAQNDPVYPEGHKLVYPCHVTYAASYFYIHCHGSPYFSYTFEIFLASGESSVEVHDMQQFGPAGFPFCSSGSRVI